MKFRTGRKPVSPKHIALTYLLFGILWIVVSDRIVGVITNSNPTTTLFQTVKGGSFVLISAGLIYLLIELRDRELEKSENRLQTASQESQVLHRILRHNIRNDLNIISGYLESSKSSIDDGDTLQKLEIAREAAEDLLSMAEKVRRVEGLEIEEGVQRPVDLVEIVDTSIEHVRRDHPSLSVNRNLPDEAVAQAGPALRYALIELFENAVDHFDRHLSDLRIEISIEQFDDVTELVITDNGPGIPDNEQAAIHAGEETPLKHPNGIGLWVVAWVVDLYDGNLSVESSAIDGTKTTIQLRNSSTSLLEEMGLKAPEAG